MLVGWIAALVFGLLRKARPQARYAVGCAALLLCAALPLAGVVERLIDAHADAHAVTTTLLPRALADASGAAAAGPELGTVAFSAGVLALRMLLGLLWVRRRSQPGRSRPDPAWQVRVNRLAARFGVRRPVRLGLVEDLPSPVTAEAIGKLMEEAGKPMDALGKKMDALGKQMEQQNHAADEVVRGLIRDAMAKGLAQPAPL